MSPKHIRVVVDPKDAPTWLGLEVGPLTGAFSW